MPLKEKSKWFAARLCQERRTVWHTDNRVAPQFALHDNAVAMRAVVFHYHLMPGGVTDVIVSSLAAIAGRVDEITAITLVTGREDGITALRERLEGLPLPVSIEVMPEIDYADDQEALPAIRERIAILIAELSDRFGGDDSVWWVHNYHVGKNPYFTAALLDIASANPNQRMIFHIHDFPECARYENLSFLTRVVDSDIYPMAPNLRYAVINDADCDALIGAGVSANSIFLLRNPLAPEPARRAANDEMSRHEVHDRLWKFAERAGFTFRRGEPLFVYPVRSIRRKNVFEAALLVRLIGQGNLVVTLPGVSEPEQGYSDLVESAYSAGLIPGVFGCGASAEVGVSFGALTAAANVILSSSVQEGFGLLFVNALRWEKPLFARRLPVLRGIESVFSGYPHHFYDRVMIPSSSPSEPDLGARLRACYKQRICELDAVLPSNARAAIKEDVDAMTSSAEIDFSYLTPEMQYSVLLDLADDGYRAKLVAANNEVIGVARKVGRARHLTTGGVQSIDAMFGYDTFAGRVSALLDSFDQVSEPGTAGRDAYEERDRRGESGGSVQRRLIAQFAHLENLRLLSAPYPG